MFLVLIILNLKNRGISLQIRINLSSHLSPLEWVSKLISLFAFIN
jgi:hypothetical protein